MPPVRGISQWQPPASNQGQSQAQTSTSNANVNSKSNPSPGLRMWQQVMTPQKTARLEKQKEAAKLTAALPTQPYPNQMPQQHGKQSLSWQSPQTWNTPQAWSIDQGPGQHVVYQLGPGAQQFQYGPPVQPYLQPYQPYYYTHPYPYPQPQPQSHQPQPQAQVPPPASRAPRPRPRPHPPKPPRIPTPKRVILPLVETNTIEDTPAPIPYQTLRLLLIDLNRLLCTPHEEQPFHFCGTYSIVADPAVNHAARLTSVAWALIRGTAVSFNVHTLAVQTSPRQALVKTHSSAIWMGAPPDPRLADVTQPRPCERCEHLITIRVENDDSALARGLKGQRVVLALRHFPT
ncbi:hypothetical protein B0H17DRAFT_1197356 [Mycena rosella]|uniref:Uncharacterized protein n=1 Tax=Mycena rosella TaxID=1033263 RepID=A0AAD7DR00_MYCRO|nr:hypothetical protein B0H17DRAFT_1197356 [Mycena rosella]